MVRRHILVNRTFLLTGEEDGKEEDRSTGHVRGGSCAREASVDLRAALPPWED